MVTSCIAASERPRFARGGVAVALVGALAVATVAALAPGLGGTTAHADSLDEQRQQQQPAERRARLLPPARVILPAPWEQASPVRSPPSTEAADRK